MNVVVDTGLVLIACVLLVLTGPGPDAMTVAWLLVAVAVTGICVATRRRRPVIVLLTGYLLLACLSPAGLVGMPLVAYDLALTAARSSASERRVLGVAAVPLLLRLPGWVAPEHLAVLVAAVLAALLAARTLQAESVRTELHAVRDDLHERLTDLRSSRARLQEAQEHETRAAALAERTRIARDIHDDVGHQLTRLLYQVKALRVVHREAPDVMRDLAGIDATVEESLASMRRSVHALSQQGEDLATALNVLAARSAVERVSVDCALTSAPPARVARCVSAVVREALTNAARHGGAGSARVVVTDYPAFWRVAVDNDGTVPVGRTDGPDPEGLGLVSITDRVEALGGTVRIAARPRFTLLVTIPKGGS